MAENVITLPPKDRDAAIKRVSEVLRFFQQGKPVSRLGMALVIGIWLLLLALIVWIVAKGVTKS